MDDTDVPPDNDEINPSWTHPVIRGYRSTSDRYVAGVLGGLGERFNLDPMILRLIVVAASVALRDGPPLVPMLYALGWIAIPPKAGQSLLATANQRRSLREIAGVVVGTALAAFAITTPALWSAGALAVGAWLLLSERDPAAAPNDWLSSTSQAEPVDDEPLPSHGASGDHAGSSAAAQWGRARRGLAEPLRVLHPRATRARRPKRAPALWPLTLGLLVMLGVVCAAIDRSLDPGLDPAMAINAALIIIGSVLALSAWRGRAGWPTLLAPPLVLVWIAFSAADIGRFDGGGSQFVQVLEAPEGGHMTVDHGYGDLHLVVSETALPRGRTLYLATRMTAGITTVVVPDNTLVTLRSRAGFAQVIVDGASTRWHSDTATLIGNSRTRIYSALANECLTEHHSPEELSERYGYWAQEVWGDSPGGAFAIPDFYDPDTAAMRGVGDFLSGVAPNLTPEQTSNGLTWTTSRDSAGQPCDPEEPFLETGSIEIDATIGLGEVHIVRSS